MPNKDNFWTSPRDDGRWEAQREGGERASRVFDTQQEAWDYTRERARETGGEAFLQGRNGRIRERNTYGDDPYPPKG
ncbi:DUF2188 domain-containing protein [Defluviimonas salinarum]|uniref:DUF2188 domain-containing protein n=1 Tax=Defluviimonas salinarum TaxID=2992147 RepID=A0ABT3IXT6_9RHOB|nr:DUF2188 domain-containing protein [Defluviimonas salinarum]MCW3780255.1 DUF2188 domain-containing protein [Defluviimonas salinarum]